MPPPPSISSFSFFLFYSILLFLFTMILIRRERLSVNNDSHRLLSSNERLSFSDSGAKIHATPHTRYYICADGGALSLAHLHLRTSPSCLWLLTVASRPPLSITRVSPRSMSFMRSEGSGAGAQIIQR